MTRIVWRKSTRSNRGGGQCVEVGAIWRTSSYSNSGGGTCVEVGPLTDLSGRIAVRDSKHREGAVLTASAPEWAGFVAALKSGGLG